MSEKLKNKVVVITGGNSGIGLETAKRFVQEGAFVFIVGRREAELEKAKNYIGSNVTSITGDVTNDVDLKRIYDIVKSDKGKIDIIVTSAGITEQADFETTTRAHVEKTFNLNVFGTFFTVQNLLPLLNDGGSIVIVSSAMSYIGLPKHSAYAASKAAVRSFSRTWASELKGRNIRVNTLSPGPIDTPMLDSQATTSEELETLKNNYASITPLGRLGKAHEIAAAALFLASDESSFSTGIDLIADGGITQL
jgi:NAD(P)-dependent dehydrogenase (short-subunit alcohol dehydrogenase family)